MAGQGIVRIGISGWTYAPWRGRFYPEGLLQKYELTPLYFARTTPCSPFLSPARRTWTGSSSSAFWLSKADTILYSPLMAV